MTDPAFNTIVLEPTLRCNLSCAMCYQHRLRETPELNIEQWVQILNRLDAKSLWLIGGEIFLRDDLFELVSYASTRGWEIGLTTNGLLVDKKCASKISKFRGIKKIVFSLDGPLVIHNMMRGSQEAYELVTQAIRLTRDLAHITVNVILNPVTVKHLVNLVDDASKLGVSKINVIFEETYSSDEIEQTLMLLSSRLHWQPKTYNLAYSKRIKSMQLWQSERDWITAIEVAREHGIRRGVMVECASVFNQPTYAQYYKLGNLRQQFRLDCANRSGHNLRLSPEGNVLGCGSIRKLLVDEIKSTKQVKHASEKFFASLLSLNLVPLCTRCCKVKVIESSSLKTH